MDRGVVVESGVPEKVFTAAESPRLRQFLSQLL
jgi:polar amino acid transport system ATP-binding protein